MRQEEREKIFLEKLANVHNNKISLCNGQKYIKNNSKLKFKCNICNYEWEALPMQLVRTNKPTGCPKCSNNIKTTLLSFKKLVYDLEENNYTVIGTNYVNNSTPILIRHNICNTEYLVRPNDFQQGYRCPKCSHGHKLKTQKEFEDEIKNLTNDKYEVLSEYKGTGKHVLMKHKECGYEWNVYPRNFLSNNTRCPICKGIISKGELEVEKILKELNLKYETQKTFEGLKYKRDLKCDFYIPDYNLVIEFDGNQHFEFSKWSREDLKFTRKRDIIKNEYFINKKINLIRIDKTNFKNIKLIITEIINKRSTTIENLNLYYIENGKIIFDNNKYNKLVE